MKISNLSKFMIVVLASAGLLSFVAVEYTKDPWNVPAQYKSMKNTVKKDATSISDGKALYDATCATCHGKTGKADGVKAKNMGIEMFDLSNADFQAKFNDGEIYYQSFIGRYPWHDFRKTVPDESDRWSIVNYIRSLKK